MNAQTIKGQTTDDIKRELANALSSGFEPTLAIVFLSIKQDREAICKMLDDHGIDIFGATTAGEFIDGEIGDESTAIMLLDIQKSHYKLSHAHMGEENIKDIAYRIGKDGLATFARPAFIVVSGGISTDGEMIVKGIEEAVGPEVTIFGGMAGDDFTMTGTYAFTNHDLSITGIVVLIIDEDKVNVNGLASSG